MSLTTATMTTIGVLGEKLNSLSLGLSVNELVCAREHLMLKLNFPTGLSRMWLIDSRGSGQG